MAPPQPAPAFAPTAVPLHQSLAQPPCQLSPHPHRPSTHAHPRRARMCAAPESEHPPPPAEELPSGPFAFLRRRRAAPNAAALRRYGLAAVLAYGMFDALTYSLSFLLSLRAYLAAGKVLTWKTLPQVLALMWGINNLSRPFRIAGALALAPIVDRRVVKPFGRLIGRLRKGDGTS